MGGGGRGWGWDGLSEDKANLSPPVGFELGFGAELGNTPSSTKTGVNVARSFLIKLLGK